MPRQRSGGALAIVLGACIGVGVAFARRGGVESEASPPPGLPPLEAQAAPAPAPHPPEVLTSPGPSTAASAPAPSASAAPPASATPPASAAPPAPSFPTAKPPLPVTTPKELERAEVRCYDKRADECERAALGYESGQFGPADAERAAHLRKVALALLVRACEKRSPHACLVLAGRYRLGIGVKASDAKASALVEHGRELCRRKPSAECVGGEPR